MYLLDSGSMATVIPAEPGDEVDPRVRLRTVDGTPFHCYGKKQIEVKLGRKAYTIEAIKAKIKSPY